MIIFILEQYLTFFSTASPCLRKYIWNSIKIMCIFFIATIVMSISCSIFCLDVSFELISTKSRNFFIDVLLNNRTFDFYLFFHFFFTWPIYRSIQYIHLNCIDLPRLDSCGKWISKCYMTSKKEGENIFSGLQRPKQIYFCNIAIPSLCIVLAHWCQKNKLTPTHIKANAHR